MVSQQKSPHSTHGRRPSSPDMRDYALERFLPIDGPYDPKLKALLASSQPADFFWPDPGPILNQGKDGTHCVGFAFCQFGNTDPVEDHFTNQDGHSVYYAAKVVDGEPGQENGTSLRSGAKVMLAGGRIDAYAFAHSLMAVRLWLRSKGPVVFGTNWHEGMDHPDPNGLLHATGKVVAGHAYVAVGDMPSENVLVFQDSFGSNFGTNIAGVDGRFKLGYDDVNALMQDNGEVVTSVELPL